MVHKQGMHMSGAHHGLHLNGFGLPEDYNPSLPPNLPSKNDTKFTDQMMLVVKTPIISAYNVASAYPIATVASLGMLALVFSPKARAAAMSALGSKGSVSKAPASALMQPGMY